MTTNLQQLKEEYIGKQFNWLTVLDVFKEKDKQNHTRIYFKCQCKCGNIKNVEKHLAINNKVKSCGCYVHSKEKADKTAFSVHKFYEDHPEKRIEMSNSVKQRYIEHPEILDKKSVSMQKVYTENPEKAKNHSEFMKQYHIENKGYLKKYYIDNPNKREEMSRIKLDFYKNNPDKKLLISKARKLYYKNKPDAILNISKIAKAKRENVDFSKLLNIVHPNQIDDLIAGNITVHDKVLTKCPICGNYDKHEFNSVFVLSRAELRNYNPPLCSNCVNKKTTSSYEQEIADYIYTIYNGMLIRNTRDIISPQELDLYYPDKSIAIEFNGDYFHNEDRKDKYYHVNKYLKCKEKDIILVSIFESEWNKNKYSIKEYIKDLFNGKENKLSFNEDHTLMNNNYPSIYCNKCTEFIEHYYIHENKKVFTCGYSKISYQNM